MDTPILEKMDSENVQFNEFLKVWRVEYTLKSDNERYATWISFDEEWNYDATLTLYKGNWVSHFPTPEWKDAVLEKCVHYIYKHSKDRLKLLGHRDAKINYVSGKIQ